MEIVKIVFHSVVHFQAKVKNKTDKYIFVVKTPIFCSKLQEKRVKCAVVVQETLLMVSIQIFAFKKCSNLDDILKGEVESREIIYVYLIEHLTFLRFTADLFFPRLKIVKLKFRSHEWRILHITQDVTDLGIRTASCPLQDQQNALTEVVG